MRRSPPVCHRALGRANERALPVEDGEPRRLSQQYPCPHEQECSASSAGVAGAILRLLASDGGAPAPRRPPARTAPGGGFGRGAEPPPSSLAVDVFAGGGFGGAGGGPLLSQEALPQPDRPTVGGHGGAGQGEGPR